MDVAERSSVPDVGVLVAGRYRITGILGQGGMGLVLSARDEKVGRDVALKLLQSIGDANVERFLREARVAAKVESQHVAEVLDVGSRAGRPFLVLERLRGEDYGAMLRDPAAAPASKLRPLALHVVADCIVQTCEALARAHGAGIVHRDVKASNLFAHRREDDTEIVKVLDFGVSKLIAGTDEPERTLTRTNDSGVLGSPPYMSPEHVRDPRAVDHRTDLWSLGVVAYRLLSARYPFPGDSAKEVLAAIVAQRPRRLRDHGVDVPESVEAIIGRCLASNREDRYSDAGALAAAFAPFASERWRRYGEIVPEIVRRTPAPAAPPPEPALHALLDARALLADPPTCTVAPEVQREAVRQSVTLLMEHRPVASPPTSVSSLPAAPTATPVHRPQRASKAVVPLVAVGALVALVAVGVRARTKPGPPHSPSVARAEVSVASASEAPVVSSSPEAASSVVPNASPALSRPPAGTPIAPPRPTRRRPPAAPSPTTPPAVSVSQPPSVLQPNPYTH